MASNRISVVIDVAVDRANQALGGFRKSIGDADGAVGKFKAGAASAFGAVKANAGEFAVAAGAALVAFGAKAVDSFTDAALAAGKFADATGVSTEEASRWVSAADDIGVSAEAVEKAFVKMTVEMGKGNAVFDKYGIEVVKAADGTDDMNATMLNAIDVIGKIPNASEKARVAQQLFGRGYAEVAELVMNGSEGVIDALESTSDAQIFDDDEVRKARDYRAAMDNLGDAVTDVTMIVGEQLTPVITDATNAFMEFKSVAADIGNLIPGPLSKGFGMLADQVQRSLFWPKYILDFKGALTETTETTGTLGKSITEYADKQEEANDTAAIYIDHAKGMQREVRRVADETAAATTRMEAAWDSLNQELSDRSAYLDIQDAIADVEAAYLTALETTDKTTAEQEADLRNVERAVIAVREGVNTYAQEIAKLPPEYATELQALIDEGAFAEVERRLATLEKIRVARITPETYMPSTSGNVRFRAGGGTVGAGEITVVGERGPEIAEFPPGTKIHPTGTGPSMGSGVGGGSPTYNFTIVESSDPDRTVRAIREFVKRNGPIQGIT